MSSASTNRAKHPVHVSVMRLFKPKLHMEQAATSADMRLPSGLGNGFALTGMLSLPEEPGETYLGQQFRAFVRVTNTHSRPLSNVTLTVELVTPRVRHVFVDKRNKGKKHQKQESGGTIISPQTPQDLDVDKGLDMVIEHLLAEPGTHKLRVTVTYLWPETGVSDTCVKQYPVRVDKPISVNLRTRTRGELTLVEAQLQNTTSEPVLLDTVKFVPASVFSVRDLGLGMELNSVTSFNGFSTKAEDGETSNEDQPMKLTGASNLVRSIVQSPTDQERAHLLPSEVQHYLFQISPKLDMDADAESKQSKRDISSVSTVGRISMVWKTCMGETAKLQTARIERDVPSRMGIEMTIHGCPGRMKLGCRYEFTGKITNYGPKAVGVRLDWREHQSQGLFACELSRKIFPKIEAGKSVEFPVVFVPLSPGLQVLGGAEITNLETKKAHILEKLASVFVVNEASESE